MTILIIIYVLGLPGACATLYKQVATKTSEKSINATLINLLMCAIAATMWPFIFFASLFSIMHKMELDR